MLPENPYQSSNPPRDVPLKAEQIETAKLQVSSVWIDWLQRILAAMWLIIVFDFVVVAIYLFQIARLAYPIMSWSGGPNLPGSYQQAVWMYCLPLLLQSMFVVLGALLLWNHSKAVSRMLSNNFDSQSVEHSIRTGCRLWGVQSILTVIMTLVLAGQMVFESLQ